MLIIGAEFALIAGLAALTVGPAAGWFAAGITQFTNWSTYHTSGKRLGAFGFALTLLAFSLQLVGPLATLYNTTITDVTFTRHSSPVKVVAWSPDGEYIASADSDTIFIWNATTKQVIGSFDDQSNTITSLAWSPDGKHLALSDESDDNQSSYTTQGTVQIEAIPNSTSIVSKLHTVYIYHSSASYINSVSWSPNGTQVLIADANGNNTLWNWGDIRKHKTWNDSSHWFSQAYQCPLSIAYIDSRYSSWSPDGTLIATACPNSGLIHIWSAKTGNGFDFPQQNSNVNSISWSPDGKSIASVTYNSQGSTQVKIWNIVMGTNIFTYDPPQSPQLLDYLTSNSTNVDVNSIAWSSDGSRLVAALTDGRAIVWDAFTGGNTITYNGFIHDGNNYSVNTVAWCPYGNRIASGGDDNTVRIWETQ